MAKKEDKSLPVNWQEEMAAHAQASAEMVKPESSTISLRGGIVSYSGTPVPDNKLQVIVLGFIHEHNFYDHAYDADNPGSPECFAFGTDFSEMAPHENAEDPQSTVCAGCPNLEWGSGNGRGKACQQRVRLMCVPATGIDSVQQLLSAEVAIIKLPVTSVKYWNQYIQQVAGMYKRPEWGVITEVSAEPDAKTQFKATFTPVAGVDFTDQPELYGAIQQKIELSQPILYRAYEPNAEVEKPKPKSKARKNSKARA